MGGDATENDEFQGVKQPMVWYKLFFMGGDANEKDVFQKFPRCAGHLGKKFYQKEAYMFKKISRCAGHVGKKSYQKQAYMFKKFRIEFIYTKNFMGAT